jgi:hypothetical protein
MIARSGSNGLGEVGVGQRPTIAPQHVDPGNEPSAAVGVGIDHRCAPPDACDRRRRPAVRRSDPIERTHREPRRAGMLCDLAELHDPVAPGRLAELVPLGQGASDDHHVPQFH